MIATPAAPLRASERIAEDLRRIILQGEVPRGGLLAPTAEMMARYGVSRPTLREAFRVLESEGLIAVKQGSRAGVRVLAANSDGATRVTGQTLQAAGATLQDLYDARLAFEPHAAGLLAERRDRRDIAALRAALATLEGHLACGRWGDLAAGLARFHHLLVELTGNKVLALTAGTIADLLEHHQRGAARPGETEPARIAADFAFRSKGPRSIAKLARLIEAGQAAGAEAHWRAHLVNANETWLAGQDRHRIIDMLR